MLFDLASDPHEQHDVAADEPEVCAAAEAELAAWREACLAASPTGVDPLDTVLEEGGPWHVRGHLLAYAERLRATGRGDWADELLARHPREAAGVVPLGGF